MEKSYVGMTQCFFCNKGKDILLDTRLRERFNALDPYVGVMDMEPCNECKALMEQGIILISAKDEDIDSKNPFRTGGWVVITEEAIRKIIAPPELLEAILKNRFCFVPDTAWKNLGLPRSDFQKQSFREKRRARRDKRKKKKT